MDTDSPLAPSTPNYTELLGEQGTATLPPPQSQQPQGGPQQSAPPPNKYEQILHGDAVDGAQQIKQSVAAASKRGTPERWAKVLEIAEREHLPADVVDRNYEMFTQAHDRNSLDYSGISHETPAVGKWLQDPDNATLARREIEPLQQVERGVAQLSDPVPNPNDAHALRSILGSSINELHASAWQLGMLYGLTDPHTAAVQVAEANRRKAALQPDFVKEFDAAMAQHGNNFNAATRGFIDAQAALRRGETLQALREYGTGTVKTVGQALDMVGAAMSRPRALTYQLLESLGQMAPVVAGQMAGAGAGATMGSLAGPVGTVVGGIVGGMAGTGVGMAPVAVGQAITQELQKRGVRMDDEASLEKAFSDPAFRTTLKNIAQKKGLTVAGVTALFGGLGSVAGATASLASKGVQTAVKVADVGVQAGGQGVAQLAGQKAVGEKLDPGAALATGISMLAFGVAHAAVHGAGGELTPKEGVATPTPDRRSTLHPDPVEAANEVHQQTGAALRTMRDTQVLSEVGKAIEQAPTTASAPSRFKSLIETASGGKDASHIYFQGDDWDKYWTQQGASPMKAAADIMGDGGKAYDRAKATGALFQIPIADYFAKVGPDKVHWEGLLQDARTVANGPSLKEAQEHLEALPQTMATLAKEAQGTPDEPAASEPLGIKQQVAKQLTEAGVAPTQARPQSQLVESIFKTLGNRAGIDPNELFGRYGLTVDRGQYAPDVDMSAAAERTMEVGRGRTAQGAGMPDLGPAMEREGHMFHQGAPAVPLPEGMYSKAERVINEKMGGSAKPSEIKKMLENAGIKADEFRWTGLDSFLHPALGDTPESKENILQHLQAHRLNVQEVQGKAGQVDQHMLDEWEDEYFSQHFRQIADRIREPREGSDSWTLVYKDREHAFSSEREAREWLEDELMEDDQFMEHVHDEAHQALAGEEPGVGYEQYTLPGGTNYREQLFTLPDIGGKGFAEGHFQEANVFAHLRMKDRLDAQGRKMLFAEEVQSDWHQQGREKGYTNADPEVQRQIQLAEEKATASTKALHKLIHQLVVEHGGGRENWPSKQQEKVAQLEKVADADNQEARRLSPAQKVQDAPFKKNWHEFVMKRLLQYAVQHGYDAIGWTKGETQVARYPIDQEAQARNPQLQEKATQINTGMRGFYDKILPDYLNKLGKKYGAQAEEGQTSTGQLEGLGNPKEKEPTSVHEMVITPELRAQVKNIGFELFQAARGRITFGDGQHFNISLLEGADRSTFLHETGHLYLQVMQDLAKETPALQQDYATIRDWVGAPTEQEGFTREQHEQFARGFESYLMEGKAPSVTMRSAFFRFKQWLTAIYHELSGLNVQLTPEVRKVFDRMIASDEEIGKAEKAAAVEPMFENPKEVGMNEEDAAKYATAVADAHQAAEEQLTQRMMKDLTREESKQWADWSTPVKAQVTQEVNANNTYQALDYLTKGTVPEGLDIPAGMKLSKLALVRTYGKDILNGLPRAAIAMQGGVHPDVVAELFGFTDGRDMLDAMRAAPQKDALIAQQTNQRVQAEHGARATPEEIQQEAQQAVRGSAKRVQLLRKELEILATQHLPEAKGMLRAITKTVPPTEAITDEAQKTLGAQTVGSIRPYDYDLAARRNAKQAKEAFLSGDVDAAFQLKRKELLSTELFNSATDARQEVEKAVEGFKRIFGSDERLAKGRDMDLVNAARAVLARVNLGESETPPEAHLEQMQRYDPETYRAVQELVGTLQTATGDYQELPLDTFRQVKTTVDALWDLSKRTQQFESAGKIMDRQIVKDALTDRAAELTKPVNLKAYKQSPSTWDRTKLRLLGGEAALRRTESWADAMDGLNPNGVFKKYIYQPVSDGATALRKAYKSTMEDYAGLAKTLRGTITKGDIPAPELVDTRTGQPFAFRGKQELLGALWHTGNDSNLQKLLVGRGWGSVDDEGTLDRSHWDTFIDRAEKAGIITKGDWDYVHGVWKTFEQLKPDAQRAHKDMFGYYFNEITAQPFTTSLGEHPGGYVPALVDRAEVPEGVAPKMTEALDHSFMFPQRATTGRGFTYSRDEAYAKPLIMNPDLMSAHVDAILRFTHLEPRVRDVNRITLDQGVRRAISAVDPAANEMLNSWLDRSARQAIETPGMNRFADNVWRGMRNNAATQVLAGNAVVPLLMVSHFSGGMIKSGPVAFGRALFDYTRHPMQFIDDIHDMSDFMATRSNAGVIEIEKSISRIMLDPGLAKRSGDWLREHGTFLMHAVQHVSDHATWAAKYDYDTGKGVTHDDAVRNADSAVRLTQGSFNPEDLSKFEAGTPFVRALNTFYSFFNTKANLMKTEFQGTVHEMGLLKGAGRLFYVYMLGYAVPAVMAGVTRQAMSGNAYNPDDDGVKAALKLLFESHLEMGTRMVPGASLGQAAYDMFAKHGDSSDEIASAPVIKELESLVRSPKELYDGITDKFSARGTKDLLSTLGLFSRLPLTAVGKGVSYLQKIDEGTAQPTSGLDKLRGLLTGQAGGH